MPSRARTPLFIALGMVGVVAVVVLALLVARPLDRDTFTDTQVVTESVSQVDADVEAGNLVIVGSNRDDVQLVQRVSWTLLRPSISQEVDGDTLQLASRCRGWVLPCSVSFELHVPTGTSVTTQSGSGDIDIRDVASLEAETGSGDIVLRQLRGPVDVQTGSGGVTVSDVTGPMTARTGSGDVRGTGVASSAATAETGSGSVSLELADGAGQVDASTGSGDVTLTLAGAPDEVPAETGSGNITLQS